MPQLSVHKLRLKIPYAATKIKILHAATKTQFHHIHLKKKKKKVYPMCVCEREKERSGTQVWSLFLTYIQGNRETRDQITSISVNGN